jgi:hypothetical protein
MPAIARPIKPDAKHVRTFIESLFEEDLHAKRVLSLGNGVVGAIEAAALGVHAIGHGLADVDFLDPKHAIKQVDRLLSNSGVDVEALQVHWVAFVVGQRDELVVAIDWTEFQSDGSDVQDIAAPAQLPPASSPRDVKTGRARSPIPLVEIGWVLAK